MAFKRYAPIGLNEDIDPIELAGGAYQEAVNMVPRTARMKRCGGYEEVWPTPLFGPIYLQYSSQLGGDYWLYCSQDAVATVDNSGVHTDISPLVALSPVAAGGWTGGTLNGISVINGEGDNQPLYWFEGEANAAPLPGMRADTTYSVVRAHKYHLIGLGYSDATGVYRDGVQWSDAADPGQIPQTWLPAEDNEAGDNVLADEPGPIIDGRALRDSFFIYKQDSIYAMDYVGGNIVYQFAKVFSNTGVLTRNCIASVKGSHVVLGNGDIYRHDGNAMESLITGKLRETFFENIDKQAYQKSYVLYSEPDEEVWFCVPTVGNSKPNVALVWHVMTNEFGYRDIPSADFAATGIVSDFTAVDQSWNGGANTSWVGGSGTWNGQTYQSTEDRVLMADADQDKLYLVGQASTFDGETFSGTVGVYGLDFGDAQRVKSIRRIWLRANSASPGDYRLELFGQNRPSDDPVLLQAIDTPGDFDDGIAVNVNTRYLGIRVTSFDPIDWDIAGFDCEFSMRGHY